MNEKPFSVEPWRGMKRVVFAAWRFFAGLARPSKRTNAGRLRKRRETPASFSIREATAADIPSLARLHVTTWNATYAPLLMKGRSYEVGERQRREAFTRNDASWFCLVAERPDGELVGFAKGNNTSTFLKHPFRPIRPLTTGPGALRADRARFLLFLTRQTYPFLYLETRAMRFEQRISASLRPAATAALALVLFASGRPVFASGQDPASPAPTAQPTAATTPQGPQLRITADDAVRMAIENNLGIQAQRLSPQIESLGVAQARAAYTPNLISTTTKRSSANPTGDFLSGTGDVITDASLRTNAGLQQLVPWGGGRYQFTLDASKSTTTRFTNYNPQLGSNFNAAYTQPLLRDFRIDSFRQQLLLSRKQEQIADIQLRQQITVTSRNVRSAYYDLVGAIGGLKVAKQSLDLANESLRNNQRKVEVGTMAPIDIIEAQAEVSRNEEQVIVQEGQIRSFEDRLRTLIMNPSQPDFWTLGIEPTEQPSLTPKAVDVEAAVASALANRTDLAQARRQLESTGINLQYARNQKLPAVDLLAAYGLVGLAGTQFQYGSGFPPPVVNQSQRSFGDALRDVFDNQFRTWSLQLQVSYPIGTSPAEAGLAATRLRQQQQNTDIRELEMQIATAVRDVARQVNTSLKRVEATTKARGFAERRYEAAQKQMSVGLATTFQLFQAQRDLSFQLQAELNAIIAYNRALIDFEAVQIAPIGGR